jgi:hypothetical protein
MSETIQAYLGLGLGMPTHFILGRDAELKQGPHLRGLQASFVPTLSMVADRPGLLNREPNSNM